MVAPLNRALRRLPAWTVYLLGAGLAGWVVWLLFTGGLGVDPVREIEHRTGKLGLQFLIASLAVTPMRRFLGLNLMRYRRALGLTAFWFVLVHFLAWISIDMQFLWGQMLRDIAKRPYITVGMASLVMLLALAATSNSWSIRRLGPRWRQLHRLAYPAAVLAGLHFVWLVKAWPPEPMLYLGGILLLLLLRLRLRPRLGPRLGPRPGQPGATRSDSSGTPAESPLRIRG